MDGILISALTAADTRINANTIAGNSGAGIHIAGSAGVTVTNNFIGLNPAGNSIMFNFTDGVRLDGGANHNLIGGTQAAAKNVISGNLGNGVLIDGAATTLNQVSGNFIGTNVSGTLAIPNLGSGVRLDNGAHHNLVGSTLLNTERNVISGNAGYGVYLLAGANHNTVDGNFIGLTASGLAGLGNDFAGVAIISSPSNAIASAGTGTGQYISANGDEGIYVFGSASTYIGWTNYIGVGLDLTTTLGNGADGIRLDQAANTSIQAGIVANSRGAGVAVIGASAAGNMIILYIVRNNGGLPIDLNADGATPNDPGDADTGPNLLQNYPAITAVAGTVVTGTTCMSCTVFIYRAYGNPGAPGGGGLFIGTAFANGAGNWTYSFLPPGLTPLDLSASACDDSLCVVSGNTSEMSPRWQLSMPGIFRP
jgi:parallel beta-helix repeat protein